MNETTPLAPGGSMTLCMRREFSSTRPNTSPPVIRSPTWAKSKPFAVERDEDLEGSWLEAPGDFWVESGHIDTSRNETVARGLGYGLQGTLDAVEDVSEDARAQFHGQRLKEQNSGMDVVDGCRPPS